MNPDVKLEKLKEMLSLLNEGLTKSEFTDAFKEVLKVVKDIKGSNEQEWSAIHEAMKKIPDKMMSEMYAEMSKNEKKTVDTCMQMMDKMMKEHEAKMKAIDKKMASIRDGADGVDGVDGKTPTKKELIALIEPLIPEPIKGDKGDTGASGNTTRIGWGAHPMTIYDGTTVIDKNARIINFGSNLTVSRNASGVITVSATAAGVTELTATGTINGVNTAFTFVSAPTYIFIDGVKYRENEGWTWDLGTLTATVTKAPDYSIWGEA